MVKKPAATWRMTDALAAKLQSFEGKVRLQDRFHVPVLGANGRRGELRRTGLPAPLHLTTGLASYRMLSIIFEVEQVIE